MGQCRLGCAGPPAASGNRDRDPDPAAFAAPMPSPRCSSSEGVVRLGLVFEFDLRVRGLAGKIKAGEYAIPSGASMAADRRHPGGGQIHPAQAHRRRRPDQRDDLEAGQGRSRAGGRCRRRCRRKARCCPKPISSPAARPAAPCWPRWPGRRTEVPRRPNGPARAEGLPFKSPREAMILASIVEKETALPEERRHVASVFVNRLRNRHEAADRSHHHL